MNSILNVQLSGRKETIVVDKVLRRIPKADNGFPAVEILDDQGRRHLISSKEVMENCSKQEFERIQKGAVFTLRMREFVTSISLKLTEKDQTEGKTETDYTWVCRSCQRGGSISSGILSEVDSVGQGTGEFIERIAKTHEETSPYCKNPDIEIFDQDLVSKGRLCHLLATSYH